MRIQKFIAIGLTLGISLLSLWGCSGQSAPTSDKKLIGVASYNGSDTFLRELVECFRRELSNAADAQTEPTIMMRDAAGSQRTQNDQIKEMVDAGCSLLCVNLVDRTDPSEIIDLARENNIPIIFYNREPVAEDLMQWDQLFYVGADAKQSGILQGELAADYIKANPQVDRNKDGKIQYVVLEGEPGHQDSIIRTENAVDTLRNQGIELEKLSYGIANWNRAQAQNRMAQIISEYQTQIELVLSNNDDMALGAIDAYEKLNYTESALPVFFGIDGTKEGLDALIDAKLAGTVYNDKEGQAQAMAHLTLALLTSNDLSDFDLEEDKYMYLPYFKVTDENVGDLLRQISQTY